MLKPIEHWKNTLGKLGTRVQRRRVRRKSVDIGCSYETLESRIAMSIDSPVIAGLLASPISVPSGSQITLTATGVTDPNGDAISYVEVFRDVDNDGAITVADGSPLGTDTDGSDGWIVSASTTGFPAGDNQFLARAVDATNLASDPVAATATVLLAPQIIDNTSSAGYSTVSSNYWSTSSGGYSGGHQFEFGASNGYAQWTFANLPDGEYQVSATWLHGSNYGTNVPYTVFDGSLDVGTTRVNQRVAPSADVVAGSKNFQHLGSFTVVNGSLVVRMTNSSGDGRAIADAVRLQHLGPAQQTSDIRVFNGNAELSDGVSAVSLGTTFLGTPSAAKTLTVKNVGLTDLVLTPLTGANMPAGITLVSSYGATTLARGESTTFQVKLSATSPGNISGVLSLPSNDPDEANFGITLTGVVNASKIIDNFQAGYAVVSNNYWSSSGGGYGGGHQFEFGTTGGYAQWTFGDLPAGSYQVFATWLEGTNRGTNVPYTIYDGSFDAGMVSVNQRVIPAGDVVVSSKNFQSLGTFSVINGAMVVRMTNSSGDGRAIADAIRIQYLGEVEQVPDVRVFDGATELTDGASTVSLGTTFFGTPVATKTLTVQNSGLTDLVLTPLTQAAMPAGVTLVSSYGATTLARGESTTIQVALSPLFNGLLSSVLTLPSNDPDEAGFDVTLTGFVDNAKTIDNGDNGYSTVSSNYWTTTGGAGYSGGYQFEFGATGGYAQWSFGSLPAGEYRVLATWPSNSSNSSVAPYSILDGSTALTTTRVNQKLAPAADVVAGGHKFQVLDTVSITNGSLAVRLTHDGVNRVIADAIRIEYVGTLPEVQVSDTGSELIVNGVAASVLNFGPSDRYHKTTKVVAVANTSSASFSLTQITQGDLPAGYVLVDAFGASSLAPGESAYARIRLDAILPGTYGGSIPIQAGTESFDLQITGQVIEVPVIVDNGDPEFVTTGSGWQNGTAGTGFGDDHLKASGAATGRTASWTVEGLAPGAYFVYATYVPSSGNTAAAPYKLYDGAILEQQSTVNQRQVSSTSPIVSGTAFGYVGQIYVNFGTLKVELDASNVPSGWAIADAIYVVPKTLGQFEDFSAPGAIVTGSSQSLTTQFVDPDGDLVDSIDVYRDSNRNGVLDLGIDQLFYSDTNPGNGLDFDLSALASGVYHFFVAAMDNGAVVETMPCTCTVSTWWTVSLNSWAPTKGEAKFDSYGALIPSLLPFKLASNETWQDAVWNHVGGVVATYNTEQPDTYTYPFSRSEAAYKLGTFGELKGPGDGGKFNPFPGGNEPSPDQQMIVLEDLTDSVDPQNPNDTDYDDQYWFVSVSPFSMFETVSPEPGTCSCDCSCSDTALTTNGGSSADPPISSAINATQDSGTGASPNVRIVDTLPQIYNPQAYPLLGPPDTVEVNLTFGGVEQPSVHYSAAGFAPGDQVFLAAIASSDSWTTGRYDWEMTVRYVRGTESEFRVFVGTQDVVSRADNELGQGLSISEIDRLYITSNSVNLVTGTNHAIWFPHVGGGLYTPEVGFPMYSGLVRNGNGTFTLTTTDGMKSHFSASGLLTSRVDPVGNTRTYTYSGGKISTITDEVGRVTTFNYSGSRISSIVDFDGEVTNLTHDGSGSLTSVTQPDPDGAGPQTAPVTTYGYYEPGMIASITNPRGEVTLIDYDPVGNVSMIVQPCGGTSTYTMYRSLGFAEMSGGVSPAPLTSADAYEIQRDEHGFETHIKRDRFGGVVWERDALGNVTTITRNVNGMATRIDRPDPDGPSGPLGDLVTLFSYDTRGNVTQVRNPDGTHEFWTYEPTFSRPTSYTDPLGRQTLWEINPANGLVLSTTDVVGAVDSLLNGETDDITTSFTYTTGSGTLKGLVQTMTDALGRVMSMTYTARGLLESMTQAVGTADETSTSFEYDTSDNLTAVVDALGRRTEYEYDRLHRLISLTQAATAGPGPEPFFWQFAYDADGNQTSMTDPLGNITEYVYDERGRLSEVIQADPDGAGPLTSPTTTYDFNCVNNLVGIADALGRETELEYDGLRRLVRAISPDPDGAGPNAAPTVEMAYNNVGWVTSETDPHGNLTGYIYDAMGRVLSVTEADPDGAGPLASPVTSFTYDAVGQLLTVTDPLGRVTTFAYDDLGRVTSVTQPDPDGAGPLTAPVTNYGYDKLGNVTSVTDPLGHVTLYAYDSLDRLTTITEADPDGAGPLASPVTTFAYDVASQLVATTDPLGRVTAYAYDNLGRLTTVTSPDPDGVGPATSPETTYAYDLVGNVTSVTDPLGNVTAYAYDNLYRLTSITQADPDGAGPLTSPVTTFAYDAAGQLVTVTDALGRVLSYAYDGLGRTTTVTQPDPDGSGLLAAPVTSYGYDNIGNVTSMTDPRGNITLYAYDNLHRVTTVTEADPDDAGPQSPPVTTFSYDAAGQLLATTDPLGRVTGYAYDRLGRTTSVTRPDPDGVGPDASPVTSFGYDSVGNLIAETDPLGNVTLYGYDNLNRLTTVTEADPDGAGPESSPVTTRAYDVAGQLVAFVDQIGRVSTNDYDALGRLTMATGPDPDGAGPELAASMAYAYDRVGNVVAESNRLGHTTTYAYDNLYRLTEISDANGEETLFAYDSIGNRLSLTDPSGNTTSWVYDALDRVIEEENELGASRYFAYDVSSNLIQRTDRNGRVTQFTYDNLDRQTSEKWMSGSTVVKEYSYSYDAASQLLAAGDGTSDYSYTYDLLGRVKQWTTNLASLPSSVTLNQTFDAASRRTSLFATLGATADFKNEFEYDNLNRLTGLTQQGQSGGNTVAEKRINFAYLADGLTSEISRFADVAGTQNVVNTTFGYDAAGRLTALTHAKDTTTFAGYGFSYDAANRMTSFTNLVYAAEDAVYTHDDLGQLTGADRTGSGDDEAYFYDENGNRVTANGDSYTTSANNQIASDGTNSYAYDAEGNITRITNIATGDYRDLEWDYRNRLTTVTQFDASDIEQWRVEYVYDVYNRLVGRTEFTGGVPTPSEEDFFVYHGYQMILKLDGSGYVQSRMLWGNEVDQILAAEDAAGNVTWPLTDHLNTVRDIVSYDSGTDTTTLGNHIAYNSFGEVSSETNPSVESAFKFTARYTDATTGLQWNLHRWYVPSIGRWASEDPIGFAAGDPNLARYVGNDPTIGIDPTGLQQPWEYGHNPPPPPAVQERLDKGLALAKDYLDVLEKIQELESYIDSQKQLLGRGFEVRGSGNYRYVDHLTESEKDYVAKDICGANIRMRALEFDADLFLERLLTEYEDFEVPPFVRFKNDSDIVNFEGGRGGLAVLQRAMELPEFYSGSGGGAQSDPTPEILIEVAVTGPLAGRRIIGGMLAARSRILRTLASEAAAAAKRIGVALDDLVVKWGKGRVRVTHMEAIKPQDVGKLLAYARCKGAKTLVLETGPVVNLKLSARIERAIAEGKRFLGGTPRLVSEAPTLLPGDPPVKYFEIIFR